MNKEQVSKLLNRTLTSSEVTNFDLYIKIAYDWLKTLLCFNLCSEGGERIFLSRNGFRSLNIDPCTSVLTVTVDTTATTEYTLRQNESYNGDWYNVIEFDDTLQGEKVTVNAIWGFNCIPSDLQLLIAKLFNQISVEQTDNPQIKSKTIEDFSVTYRDGSSYDELVKANQATIAKYSQCNIGDIQHGSVQYIC